MNVFTVCWLLTEARQTCKLDPNCGLNPEESRPGIWLTWKSHSLVETLTVCEMPGVQYPAPCAPPQHCLLGGLMASEDDKLLLFIFIILGF